MQLFDRVDEFKLLHKLPGKGEAFGPSVIREVHEDVVVLRAAVKGGTDMRSKGTVQGEGTRDKTHAHTHTPHAHTHTE